MVTPTVVQSPVAKEKESDHMPMMKPATRISKALGGAKGLMTSRRSEQPCPALYALPCFTWPLQPCPVVPDLDTLLLFSELC